MNKLYPAIFVSLLFLFSCSVTATTEEKKKPSTQTPPSTSSQRPITNLAENADVQNFIDDVSKKHDIDKQWLTDVFNKTSLKKTIVTTMDRPAEGMNWGKYRKIFITDKRINGGITFYKQYKKALERAESTYGVDATVIAAIIGVETSYGENRGNWAVIDALATLSFDYPRRSAYFKKELENFLQIVQETKLDPFSYKGSYAGAMGYPQFMPSSYLAHAVDFDNDGIRDLWNNPIDAIGSVGNYLNKSGWRKGGPIASKVSVKNNNKAILALTQKGRLSPPKNTRKQLSDAGVQNLVYDSKGTLFNFEVSKSPKVTEWWVGYQNFYAITRYNHSKMYALAVYQLADAIKRGK